MNSKAIITEAKRTIIVVGKTGAGKSKLLNDILERRIFLSSADTTSCTTRVEISEWEDVRCNINTNIENLREVSFKLKAIDTPGLADSQGRSKQFLNEIAQTIRATPLNLIIILVEYGRFDDGLYGNLEVVSECLNTVILSFSFPLR